MSTDEAELITKPYRWKPLELFHTVYPDDPDNDKLDFLFPNKIGDIYKRDDGSVEKIVIHRVWPHEQDREDEDIIVYDSAELD